MISEDYPQEFDWEYFKSLDNLKDIVKYATSKLGRPKKGSSRLTYLMLWQQKITRFQNDK